MALWISHRVLLTNELIGKRTNRGMPTEMNAKRLIISLAIQKGLKILLGRHTLMNSESVLDRDIIQREFALVTW